MQKRKREILLTRVLLSWLRCAEIENNEILE
jgi:hypothetical protein